MTTDANEELGEERKALVEGELRARGVNDPRVLAALLRVPREEFVPLNLRRQAYANVPLAIGREQTISQPLIVGLMSQLLKVKPGDRVLEVGTGSGYQTAILVELGADVYSIERIAELGERAKACLSRLGYATGCNLRIGDGYKGWPEAAPFRGILVTAAPEAVPQELVDQLAEGGRLVIPVGPRKGQFLEVWEKRSGKIVRERHGEVSFVPMLPEVK